MRTPLLAALLLAATAAAATASAQFDLEESHTSASLRGIHSVGGGVAWASGTDGTVLRTEDGGYLWQTCSIPPGAEHLDFRGIQAFDANTAIVMSSGPGDLSRLYKTTDACQTWKLVFTNPDKEGFWDAIQFWPSSKPDLAISGVLLGDPVANRFVLEQLNLYPPTFNHLNKKGPRPHHNESAFAASNQALALTGSSDLYIATGGSLSEVIHRQVQHHGPFEMVEYRSAHVPIGNGAATSGIFALSFRRTLDGDNSQTSTSSIGVAVGGDYTHPDSSTRTATYTADRGRTFRPAQTQPHGYRSSVAYDPASKTWITTGPNGTDISRDDGRTWQPLKPSPQDPPDADKNWNALSLPFVVGPHGRIGKLRPLKP